MPANVDSLFYYGEKPWHGLGTELDHPATSREAILAAKLNWRVKLEPAYLKDKTRLATRAIRREDTKAILGEVGPLWQPIQNEDAFDFFDAVSHNAKFVTAGSLGMGERIWLLALLPGVLRIKSTDDVSEKYLAFINNHTGKGAAQMFPCPVRIVCQNTWNQAKAVADRSENCVSIRHTGNIKAKIQEAQRILGLAIRYYDNLNPIMDRLAEIQPSPEVVKAYFTSLFPESSDDFVQDRNRRIRSTIWDLFVDSKTNNLPGIQGSMWAAFNAVTEYVDHVFTSRGRTDLGKRRRRLQSIWFGQGAQLKRNAWNNALATSGISLADASDVSSS